MSHTDRSILRDLLKAWLRGEHELEELIGIAVRYFREGVMPTTPPDGGT